MITMTPTAEQKIRELLQEEKDTIGLSYQRRRLPWLPIEEYLGAAWSPHL